MDDGIVFAPLDDTYTAELSAWSGQKAVNTLMKQPETLLSGRSFGWVAVHDNDLLAAAIIATNQQHISYLDIIVKPAERRHGVGYELLSYVLAQPAVQALHHLRALVEFENTAARKILSREGFSRIGYSQDGRLELEKH